MPQEFPSRIAPAFKDIPPEKWNDWRWQLSHRLNTVEEFEKVLKLKPGEKKALSSPNLFRVDVTPYFVSLIDPDDPHDPIRKQIIPTVEEMSHSPGKWRIRSPKTATRRCPALSTATRIES